MTVLLGLGQLEQLFAKPDKPCTVLSSIHRAKGLEWPRVFWLCGAPSRWAQQEWQARQEVNLSYVATTRAMRELVIVHEADEAREEF